MDAADHWRNAMLVAGFVVTTCISMYSGLKCVVFHYDKRLESSEGALLGSIEDCIELQLRLTISEIPIDDYCDLLVSDAI